MSREAGRGTRGVDKDAKDDVKKQNKNKRREIKVVGKHQRNRRL